MGTWGLLFSFLYLQILEIFHNKKIETERRLGLEGNNDSLVLEASLVPNWLLGLQSSGKWRTEGSAEWGHLGSSSVLATKVCVTLSQSYQSWINWITRCFQVQILMLVLDSFQPLAVQLVLPCSSVVNGTTVAFLSACLSRFPKIPRRIWLFTFPWLPRMGGVVQTVALRRYWRDDGSLFNCLSCPVPESRLLTSLSKGEKTATKTWPFHLSLSLVLFFFD